MIVVDASLKLQDLERGSFGFQFQLQVLDPLRTLAPSLAEDPDRFFELVDVKESLAE